MSLLIQPGFAIRRKECPADRETDCGPTGFDGFHACCPSSFTCPGPQYNVVCCPDGATNCTNASLARAPQPSCANGTWDMFDNGGYFCCEHGLPGYNQSNTNGCATPNVALPAGIVLLSTVRVGVDSATVVPSASSVPQSSSSPTSTPVSASASASPASSSSESSSSTPIGAIVGGVVGGIAVLALVMFLTWFCMRRRRQKRTLELHGPSQLVQDGGYGVPETQKYAMEAGSHDVHEAGVYGARHEVGEMGARTPDAELAAPQRPVELDGTSRMK